MLRSSDVKLVFCIKTDNIIWPRLKNSAVDAASTLHFSFHVLFLLTPTLISLFNF